MGKLDFSASSDPNLVAPASHAAMERAKPLAGGFALQVLSLMGGESFLKFYAETQNIPGIWLKSKVRWPMFGILSISITREATKIETGPIPASVFELPVGYQEFDIGKAMLEEIDKSQEMASKK